MMRPFAFLSMLAVALVHVATVRADEAPELNVITTFPNNPFSSESALTSRAQRPN